MYELFFEETPFFSTSHKMKKFVDFDSENPFNGFCIPVKVSRGERPIIPWTNQREFEEWTEEFIQPFEKQSLESCLRVCEQYLKLMRECWDQDPDNRPTFSHISNSLALIK